MIHANCKAVKQMHVTDLSPRSHQRINYIDGGRDGNAGLNDERDDQLAKS